MPSFRTVRHVRHTPEQMFELVADVEKYPEFLPLCTGMRLLRRTNDDDGLTRILAEMHVGYKAIRETFTSKVACDPKAKEIHVEYVDGPFRYLDNKWTFRDAGEGVCDVQFAISYEFRSRMLGLLMGSMFDAAFRKFAEAFERRADLVYGRR
jgi:coenzyme Q-binding protein COQ10